MAKVPAPKRELVQRELVVFRFMRRNPHEHAVLLEELSTDAELGVEADKRERRYPELLDARSVFSPESAARRRWRAMRNAAKQRKQEFMHRYVAEIRIESEDSFYIECRGQQGHMLLWGEKTQLAAKVVRIFEGWPSDGEEE
jgi:hypothetical protein